jgi:hypothetical protein
MVTLAFFILAVLSIALHASVDAYLYKISWIDSLLGLMELSFGAGRLLLILQLLTALAVSVFHDFRQHKKKKQGQQNESEAAGSG